MVKNDLIYIEHMLKASQEIRDFIHGLTKRQFFRDTRTQGAIIFQIAIMGEAIRQLSPGFQEKYSAIEWRKIAGTRNRLLHDYLHIDLELLWFISKKDNPKLAKNLAKIKLLENSPFQL